MLDSTEIAPGIHRLGIWQERDLEGILFPDATFNLYALAAQKRAIITTGFRRVFHRFRQKLGDLFDPSTLSYIIVPHHEGDSSGAVNEWLRAAPRAVVLCSDLCAILSLRDLADREPVVVADGEMLDLGSHRLRFLMTPQVNQWDSMMIYEEATQTLFPNDLFSTGGFEARVDRDFSQESLAAARAYGYQADDRKALNKALDKIAHLPVKTVATMHGPTIAGHYGALVRCFRDNALSA
jgi:flavorubredoxin